MLHFKKRENQNNGKNNGKIALLKATMFNPFYHLSDAGTSFKSLIMDGYESALMYIQGANIFRKDLYTSNIKLALFHLENGNTFDAKFRYSVAHFFKKDRTEPLLGLADIAIHQNRKKVALKHLKKAFNIAKSSKEKHQIGKIIQEIL
jgi:hypothetical protein